MAKIAIIGASELQLPLVRKANEMGLKTICFAWEDGAVCKDECATFYPVSILDKEQILAICKKETIDGIVSIASDAAVPTVSYVAGQLNLTGNPYEFAEICTNKYKMRCQLKEDNVNIPFFIEADNNELIDLENLAFPMIVKPVDRSGSRGVQKVNTVQDLKEAVHVACEQSFTGKAIVEKFIEGREVSVESISWQGKHYILAITDKVTTGAPCFVELAHHQPSELKNSLQEKIKLESIKALNSLKIQNGAAHTEILVTSDERIVVVEVGARMGGDFIGSHLTPLSTGFDYLKGVIEISLGSFSNPILKDFNFSGVYFLSQENAHLKSIIIDEEEKYIVSAAITNEELKKSTNSADRSGYLIYQSDKRIRL